MGKPFVVFYRYMVTDTVDGVDSVKEEFQSSYRSNNVLGKVGHEVSVGLRGDKNR